MILYIALALFAFMPFGAYILHQKTKNKGLVLGISFIYLLLSLFIFLNDGFKYNKYSLKETNKLIIALIDADETINTSTYLKLGDSAKPWIQSYLLDALDKGHFTSAESLISIAEGLYVEPDEKLIFYSMYTLLRDTRFPEFASAAIEIESSNPENCLDNSVDIELEIVNGPGVPIGKKNLNNANIFSISNNDSLIPGFDIASALLNNESIEIFINLNCINSDQTYSFNSIFIFDPNTPLNTYKINQNQWSKS